MGEEPYPTLAEVRAAFHRDCNHRSHRCPCICGCEVTLGCDCFGAESICAACVIREGRGDWEHGRADSPQGRVQAELAALRALAAAIGDWCAIRVFRRAYRPEAATYLERLDIAARVDGACGEIERAFAKRLECAVTAATALDLAVVPDPGYHGSALGSPLPVAGGEGEA